MANLPEEFINLISQYPALAALPEALTGEPGVAIRINTAKAAADDIAGSLPIAAPVPWAVDGYLLSRRPQFTLDPALHQGLYYVQDSSSMAVAQAVIHVLGQMGCRPINVLDACAAPGGKTTAVASVLPKGSALVANEYDFQRAAILAENLAKWGVSALVSRGDTFRLRRLPEMFDIAIVDAPCSGEGMMRKDAKAVEQWSTHLVSQCATLQREILANVWEALRPGGFLIYSTCTFNPDENERNLAWIASEHGGNAIAIPALDKHPEIAGAVEGSLPCYRFIPGRVPGEGLFLSAVQKPGNAPVATLSMPKSKKDRKKPEIPPEVTRWLDGNWEYEAIDGEIYALPAENAQFYRYVASQLACPAPGVHIATIKGRDAIPTQQLALSTALRRGSFPEADVNIDEALAYLRREAVTLPDSAPRGFVLLTYRGRPLGFVKNLGNRSNNLYPRHWRILTRQ